MVFIPVHLGCEMICDVAGFSAAFCFFFAIVGETVRSMIAAALTTLIDSAFNIKRISSYSKTLS